MKFLRLHFLAFGPFTGASLDLSGAAGLQIIYGANEAGKTSALRGVRQALFGIEHNTTDGFLHPYADLRIGALIQGDDGHTLEFVRRKGTKGVLRNAADEALEPVELTRRLDGVDETAFRTRFALDHAELRAGGTLVGQSGGGLGELLFAAGGGIGELRRIETALCKEAEQLFVPRGKNPKLNRACAEVEELLQRAKQERLPTADWSRRQEELDSQRAKGDAIDARLREQRGERDKLARYSQAQQLLAKRRQWQQEMQELAGAVLLPDAFARQHLEAAAALQQSQSNQQDAEQELAALDESLALAKPPQELLVGSAAIDSLVQQFWGYDKAQKDRPGLIERRQLRESDSLGLLRDVLKRDIELAAADSLRLTPDQKVRIQELAQERAGLAAHGEAARKQTASLTLLHEQLSERLNALPPLRDGASLERAVRRAQQQGDLAQRLADVQKELRAANEQAEIDLRRLPLWAGDLAALEMLATPAAPSIERSEQELLALDNELQQLRGRLDEQQAEAAECQRQLAELDWQHDVPSEADLAAARQNRDVAWQAILKSWNANQSPGERATEYERSVQQTDLLADRLRHEAERVSKKAALLAGQAKALRRVGDAQSQLADSTERRQQAVARWEALWQPLGISPLSPREMRGWLERQGKLIAAAQHIRTLQTQAAQWTGVVVAHRDELLAQLGALDCAAKPSDSLPTVLERAEGLLSELQRQQFERAKITDESQRAGRELPQARQALQQAEQQLAEWQTQWAGAMERLGLEPQASPAQALAILAALDEMHEKLQEAKRLRERVEGIDRDARQFEAEARRLAERLTPDLAQEPLEQMIEHWQARIQEAREKQVREQELVRKREREERRLSEAVTAGRQTQATLAALCQIAGCVTAEELTAAEQRSKRRWECQRELRSCGEQLLAISAGTPIEEFVAQAEQFDQAQLAARQEELQSLIETSQVEQKALHEEIGKLDEQIRQLAHGAPAAELQEQALGLLAGIQHDAERFARLRLASVVLRRAMERYREKNQGPVLRRAGDLFADLTLGSFQGLRTDFGDDGQTVVRGVRGGGTLGVEAMSDGTKDQLYLALRLASLEEYFRNHPPFPLLVDDILVHFDDQRAAAALRALARLAQQTQVLFFTHHQHLVQLAAEHLSGQFCGHELNCRQPALAIEAV